MNTLVITIDGPAGAGKSTIARELAKRLGFDFLDTGAMYRCVTLAVLRQGVAFEDTERIARIAESLQLEMQHGRVTMNGEDVSQAIRQPEVTQHVTRVADNMAVRSVLSSLQRRYARGRCIVTEGRDQGTEVFVDSPCKFFLTASREERARRRWRELQQRGVATTYEEVLQQQDARDARDASRAVGGLRIAADAMVVDTDGLTTDEVIDQMVQRVRLEFPQLVSAADPRHAVDEGQEV